MAEESLRPADRISQLEADSLDGEITKLIDQYVESLEIPRFSEELKLLIKCYISRHLSINDTTVGKKVYGISYVEKYSPRHSVQLRPKRYKLHVKTLLELVLPYLLKKTSGPAFIRTLKLPFLTVDNAFTLLKIFKLVSFLAFLKSGQQLQIIDRVLGLYPLLSDEIAFDNAQMNRYQVEVISRDAIWRALTEILAFMIPYINMTKMKNRFLNLLHLKQEYKTKLELSHPMSKLKSSSSKCGICNQQPFNPYIIGCRHVFCYYCLFSRYLLDPNEGFVCLLCNYCVKDMSLVSRYRCTT